MNPISFVASANKILNPDGSITLVDGTLVDENLAVDEYKKMSPIANKFLNPDGSVSELVLGGGGGGGGTTTVIDDLLSTSATDALSANQGRVLNEKISSGIGFDGKVDTFALLPDPTTTAGQIYRVLTSIGEWYTFDKQSAGFYESNGTAWLFLGTTIDEVTEAEKIAGTEVQVRRSSPKDIKDIVGIHESVNSVAGKTGIVTLVETDITDLDKYTQAEADALLLLKQSVLLEGSFVDGDKEKLDGIEVGATTNQTGAEIKTLYEAELDTNAFTDLDVISVINNTAKVGITTQQSSNIIANTAKTTNATHTGDVTGDTVLTIGSNKVLETMLSADLQLKIANGDHLNNLTATTDPTVNDDSSLGYSAGSVWINQSTTEAYRCLLSDIGGAIWQNTTLTADEVSVMINTNSQVVANTTERHTHSNKTVLDNTTASFTAAEKTQLAGIDLSIAEYLIVLQADWSIVTQPKITKYGKICVLSGEISTSVLISGDFEKVITGATIPVEFANGEKVALPAYSRVGNRLPTEFTLWSSRSLWMQTTTSETAPIGTNFILGGMWILP